jgi:hypothetical protein
MEIEIKGNHPDIDIEEYLECKRYACIKSVIITDLEVEKIEPKPNQYLSEAIMHSKTRKTQKAILQKILPNYNICDDPSHSDFICFRICDNSGFGFASIYFTGSVIHFGCGFEAYTHEMCEPEYIIDLSDPNSIDEIRNIVHQEEEVPGWFRLKHENNDPEQRKRLEKRKVYHRDVIKCWRKATHADHPMAGKSFQSGRVMASL